MSSPLISNKDIEEILRLVQAAEHVASFRMKYGDFEISLSRDGVGDAAGPARSDAARTATVSEPAIAAAPASKPLAASADEGLASVTAPMVGTFYRSPAPGADPFVGVGSRVEPDTVIGIIEVMKLMNSLNAGVKGTVRQVLAEDSRPVGYGQVLMLIEPDA